MAESFPYLAGEYNCSTVLKEYDELIYKKVGSARWPEWKHKPGIPTYELIVSATKGVRLVVKEPRFVWEITERVLEVLFDDRETWEEFFELDSPLRKLVEEACGTKVRINIFRARNDYLIQAAKAVYDCGRSKRPTKKLAISPPQKSPSKTSLIASSASDTSLTKAHVTSPTEKPPRLRSPPDSLSSPPSKLNVKEEREVDGFNVN